MSRVDVVIPCYKYAHFLPSCIESVLTEQGADARVLIIDDASPDNTAEVGAALAARDSRVEFRRHPVNQGHIATYNEGLIDWATSEYSLLLSADDMLVRGALGRAVRLMDQNPQLGFCYGKAIATESPDYSSIPFDQPSRSRIISGPQFWEASCTATGNIVPTPTAVVRTKLQQSIGGYRKELPHTGDLEMWMRFAAHAPVGIVEATQAFYRVHGKNMHRESYADALTVVDQHRVAFEGLFREYGDRIPGSGPFRAAAMRGVGMSALSRATRAFERGDRKAVRDLLVFAANVYPDLRDERDYSKLRLKRIMGLRLWHLVQPVVRSVRGKRAPLDRHPFCHSQLIPEV